MCRPGAAAPVRRAINVQLARVTRGQPGLLQSTRTGRSAARPAVAAPFPKLIVRVRFSSPALGVCAGRRPCCGDRPVRVARAPDRRLTVTRSSLRCVHGVPPSPLGMPWSRGSAMMRRVRTLAPLPRRPYLRARRDSNPQPSDP